MRFRLACVATVCVVTLAAGSALAEDTKQPQPSPKSKQELADQAAKEKAAAEKKAAEEKAAAEKAAAEKAAVAHADPAKAGDEAAQPKAAVNTLEDLFAAYRMTGWAEPATAEEAVVWKDTTPEKAPAGK